MQIRAAQTEEVLDASMYLGLFVETVGFIRIFLLIINLILFANKLKQADELSSLERNSLDDSQCRAASSKYSGAIE